MMHTRNLCVPATKVNLPSFAFGVARTVTGIINPTVAIDNARAVYFILAYHYAVFDDLFCSLFAGYDRRRMRFRVFG